MSVGLGIVTYNRVESLRQVLKGVCDHLLPVVDKVYVHDDGSPEPALSEYADLMAPMAFEFSQAPKNEGVGRAKNRLLRKMLEDGHDWIFLCEDDIMPIDERAITGYIAACQASGLQHLNFHAHGPLNPDYKALVLPEYEGVTMWPHFVGAWSIYSRESLKVGGLMDEEFHNCWEHVEHTMRLGLKGYTTVGLRFVADATGSENWLIALEDQPSVIGTGSTEEERRHRQALGQQHWAQAHPDSYSLIFWA